MIPGDDEETWMVGVTQRANHDCPLVRTFAEVALGVIEGGWDGWGQVKAAADGKEEWRMVVAMVQHGALSNNVAVVAVPER